MSHAPLLPEPAFELGVVSNVWGALLQGSSLDALCERGTGCGFHYAELRQRALGDYESWPAGRGAPVPRPERLGRLATSHPQMRFNLAVEAPLTTAEEPLDRSVFAAALESTLALASQAAKGPGSPPPFLRLVDPTPVTRLLEPEPFARSVERVRGWVEEARESGVALVLEHSRQPLSTLRELMGIVADRVGSSSAWAPLLCWDPANMATSLAPEDPETGMRQMTAAEIALFHFKQLEGDSQLPEVGPGRLPWASILRWLVDRGYCGPALFEIPPGDDIWPRLERSRDYICSLLDTLGRPVTHH